MPYDAFVSYSHEADEPLASALERGLQRLARPWHQRRGMSVFRDAGNLNLSAHLWGSIQQALDDSKFLIFVASPASARSPWVTKEIEHWRTHRDVAQLIVVLSDGSLTWDFERGDFDGPQSTAIPASLHGAFQGEPFYLDMRWVRADPGVSLDNDRFKQQVVQIAAALKGVAVEDVIGEEVEQHRRMIRIRNAAIACLGVLSVAAVMFGGFAWTQRGAAIRSGEAAQRSAEEARASASEAARRRNEAQRAQKEADASAVVATDKAAEADRERLHAETEAQSARVALAQASTREAVRLIGENRPFAALAHLARALRASPDDLAARSWTSALVHDGRSWMSLPHDAAVSNARFSSDGRRVVTESGSATRVWDADSGQPIGVPLEHERAGFAPDVSPDGRRVIVVSAGRTEPDSDGTVGALSGSFSAQVWDPVAAKPVGQALRHQDEIRSAAFGPDGRLVVTASKDKTVRLWDATTGDPVGRPLVHPTGVKRAVFTSDGRRIVSGSDDGSARVWDAASGEVIAGPVQGGQRLEYLALSQDGRRMLTVAFDRAQVWDVLTGKPVGSTITHEREPITETAFSRDGRWLAIGSFWEASARIWDVDAGKPVGPPLMHNASLRSVEFSSDGRWLLTASEDKTARLWDVATGQQLGTPFEHEDTIATATFSPDGRRILTASDDKTARVWDVSASQMLDVTPTHPQFVGWASFSPDGRQIVTTGPDRIARLWNLGAGQLPPMSLAHGDFVSAALFSPDGRRIVAASADGTASIWDSVTGHRVGTPLQHSAPVTAARFSPDGRRILTVTAENKVHLWDATTERALVTIGPLDGPIKSVDFSRDGRLIATASDDPVAHPWEATTTARVWDAATGRPVGPPVRHVKKVNIANLSPDGRRLLTASDDHTARVWDVSTGRPLLTLQHKDFVRTASFSPDGRSIVTASSDGTARLWDARSGQPIGVPMSSVASVYDAQFSADGRRVVTASIDKKARVWDAATGLPLGPTLTHSGQVYSAMFSPDGHLVLTVTPTDKNLRVWSVLLGSSSDAALLADLAEVVGGYRLTELGSIAALNESERRARVRRLLGDRANGFVTLEQLLRRFLPAAR